MANKQLTAKVRLNITDVESKIKRLDSQFKRLNNATKNIGTNNKINQQLTQSQSKLQNITSRVKTWASNQRQVTTATKSTNSVLSSLGSKLKGIAATYLGIMGAKAVLNTSDVITSTQNRLNALNGNDVKLTQQQMDKMYVSANKVRMAYTDMLSNASKSMTLAGDAFQGNMDNAIRFQEIMAEAYTLGGASAQEMSTSMYQMIQALGSGILAGDELRSVREGAPLAYKEIEKFAQKTLNSTDSLKELASQGLITSEMVTAAIMDAGDKIDEKFKQTSWTFGQAWDRIKNSAIKAFEPVSKAINKMLNTAANNGVFEKIESAFMSISKVLQITFELISRGITWIADNWQWLKYVIGGALLVIMALMIKTAAVAIINAAITAWAWIKAHWGLLLIVAALMAILYTYELLKQGALTMTDFLVTCALIIATAFLIAGVIMNATWMVVVALILIVLAIVYYFFEQVCYGAGWLAAWIVNIVFGLVNVIVTLVYLLLTVIWNIITLIVNFVMALGNSIVAISHNIVAAVINVTMGLWNSIKAICQNIGIAFQNAWNGALSSFWNFIADCLEGLDWLAKPLEKIASLFGKSFDAGSFAGSVRNKASQYKQQDFVSVSNAWNSGMNTVEYKSVSDAWSNGMNTMERASYVDAIAKGMGTLEYVDANAWGSAAGEWGANKKADLESWLSDALGVGDKAEEKTSLLDKIGKNLGLDFSKSVFPDASDPTYDVGNSYNPDLARAAGDTADNTGKMAKSLEATEEDLKYLRDVANMEWKKEYTVASIKVDMNNTNTINGDSDLDGIVTKLSEKLYEELNAVADGVYA